MKTKVLLVAVALTALAHQVFAEGGQHLFILSGQSNMTPTLSKSFTQSVEAVFGKDKVIVATLGRPSQAIKNWYKAWTPPEGMQDPAGAKPNSKNGIMYEELIKTVERATKGKQVEDVTYVWMQGEEDARAGWGSVYEKSFNGVIEQLKQDLKVDQINYVVGRINDYWMTTKGVKDGDLVRATLVKLGEAGPHAAWIDTDDLNKGVNPWGGYDECDGHFSMAAYRVMGQRFARKACLLADPKVKLDENIFKEVFFDSADQVKTHAATGKSITVKASSLKPGENKAGIEALLDGRFAKPDVNEAGWLTLAANDQAIEFLVDLGEVMPVDSVGIDLLASPGVTAFPQKIIFTTSKDGKAYVSAGKYGNVFFTNRKGALVDFQDKSRKPRNVLVMSDTVPAQARYIKIAITTAGEKAMIDEVIVNPKR